MNPRANRRRKARARRRLAEWRARRERLRYEDSIRRGKARESALRDYQYQVKAYAPPPLGQPWRHLLMIV